MGQLAFGKECLEAVINKVNDEVAAVYCTPDKENKPLDPIKEYALEQGLPVIPVSYTHLTLPTKA